MVKVCTLGHCFSRGAIVRGGVKALTDCDSPGHLQATHAACRSGKNWSDGLQGWSSVADLSDGFSWEAGLRASLGLPRLHQDRGAIDG